MEHATLTALSPIDGRYHAHTRALTPLLSEYGLMRFRLLVEIRWLQALSQEAAIAEVPVLSAEAHRFLDALFNTFSEENAQKIKSIESITNHDVKAIEYYLKERLQENAELAPLAEFVHFACTSEDINNLSYALMLKHSCHDILFPEMDAVNTDLRTLAHHAAAIPLMSRTHGQPATPTTLGKEVANMVARLQRTLACLQNIEFLGKCNGAVGNYNAHAIAYPEVNWPALSQRFVEGLGLKFNSYTTQIEPHDMIAELGHAISRFNTILIDSARDIWGYIALNHFTQKPKAGEIGSSTMPHKINPIDFENAEGNFGLANSQWLFFAEKLPISRWQRDLSDSTVLRAIGPAMGHTLIALKSFSKGLSKLAINPQNTEQELNQHWEVLAEAAQTVMRRYGIENPYEQLKAMSRGKAFTATIYQDFVRTLAIPDNAKQRLLELTPASYTGYAQTLAKEI